MRFRVVAAGLATVLAVTVGVNPPAAATHAVDSRADGLPRLRGSVGPGFEISINQETVPAGRYRLVVRDRSAIHNFHFFGAGVDRQTSVPGTGRKVWRVTLEAGTYIAACVPHGSMSTTIEVT
jgi:hypothetical protein